MSLNIVLVEPEIPQNTGSIARTCALTGVKLHLVKPLGFSVDDKYLKRAGLDYWYLVNVSYYNDLNEVLQKHWDADFYYATTKTSNIYTEKKYKDNSFFVFGKETRGLPEDILEKNTEKCINIPIRKDIERSLNLSNSANIIIYEALRQLNFPNIK